MENLRTVKRVETKTFDVEMIETAEGYTVIWEALKDKNDRYEVFIQDYKTAAIVFDAKVNELQGQ